MSDERENVDLADDEEYDRIWEIFVNSSSPALKANWTVLQQSMEENNYIGKSITLLDIGAGIYTFFGPLKKCPIFTRIYFFVQY